MENQSEVFTLSIEKREGTGKGAAGRLRRLGKIPAVAYKGGEPAKPISVVKREFVQKASRSLSSQVFELKGDAEISGKALVRDIHVDGQKGEVIHVDFLLLEEGRKAVVRVPLVVTGEAPGVKQQGGVLTVQCREVTLSALPSSIPSELEVSVDELRLGDRIRTKDIKLPENVSLVSNPEETIANIISGRAAKMAEEEAGNAGVIAPAEEAPAEGEVAAAGADTAAA